MVISLSLLLLVVGLVWWALLRIQWANKSTRSCDCSQFLRREPIGADDFFGFAPHKRREEIHVRLVFSSWTVVIPTRISWIFSEGNWKLICLVILGIIASIGIEVVFLFHYNKGVFLRRSKDTEVNV